MLSPRGRKMGWFSVGGYPYDYRTDVRTVEWEGGSMDHRLAIARKALAEAERRAGLRVVRVEAGSASSVVEAEAAADAYQVPEYLSKVFPRGIRRGQPIALDGSMSSAILLSGIAAQQGAWVAFLGMTNVGWSLVEQSGIDARRLAHVPDVGSQAAQVVSAAIDGFDVVVLGDLSLDRREQRVLERRVRTRNTLLITLGRWLAPAQRVQCTLLGVYGIDKGLGHIRGMNYRVSSSAGSADITFTSEGWASANVVQGLATKRLESVS